LKHIHKFFSLLFFFLLYSYSNAQECESTSTLKVGLLDDSFIDYRHYLYYELGNYALSKSIDFEFEYVDNNIDQFDLIFGEYNKLQKLSLSNLDLPEEIKEFYSSNGIVVSNNLLPLDLDTYILSSQIKGVDLNNFEDLANYFDPIRYTLGISLLTPKINSEIIEKISRYFNSKKNIELFLVLIKLELFPIKDSYVAFFKRSPDSIKNNPTQLKRICNRLYEMGLENLLEKIIEPKETNRQIGPMFKNWIKKTTFCIPKVDISNFDKQQNGIMVASDDQMKNYAKKKLNYTSNKGLDFIAKKNGKHLIGETKFLTDFGGHQNAQFNDAINVFKSGAKNCDVIAILDGIIYLERGKLYNSFLNENKNFPIFSALVLDLFLKEF